MVFIEVFFYYYTINFGSAFFSDPSSLTSIDTYRIKYTIPIYQYTFLGMRKCANLLLYITGSVTSTVYNSYVRVVENRIVQIRYLNKGEIRKLNAEPGDYYHLIFE